jgi:polysaccharide deacetylase family protein (PEP-CTERM system associated)
LTSDARAGATGLGPAPDGRLSEFAAGDRRLSDVSRSASGAVRNMFTVDVEEYFQVETFSDYVERKDWDRYAGRVEEPTGRLLELLEIHRARGTFFILGWLAERKPDLVRRIADAGHEIASHGYGHTMITKMTPGEFRKDVRRTKNVLEDITGTAVRGYRAPTFSIVKETRWAYPILLEEGYRYSSSVFPVRHDRYGWPEFGEEPKRMASGDTGDLWEVPLSVGFIGPMKVPFGGGGYLRWYPLFLTKRFLRNLVRNGKPVLVYIHPWELDANQPDIPAPFLRRLRHRLGISKMEGKLTELFRSLSFGSVAQFLDSNGYGARPGRFP